MASESEEPRAAGGAAGRQERRERERLVVVGDLPGEVMVFQPMLVREISEHGVAIESRFPFHLDSLHDLRLQLGDRSVVVKGRIVHSRISDVDQDVVTYRSGIEFVEPSSLVLDAIRRYVGQMRTGHVS